MLLNLWLLLLALGVLPGNAGAHDCNETSSCVSACEDAPGSSSQICAQAQCSAEFGRCDCGLDALLLIDGVCDANLGREDATTSMVAAAVNVTRFDALFNIAMFSTPEVLPDSVKTGSASTLLQEIIYRSVTAGVAEPLLKVALTNVTLEPVSGEVGDVDPGGLLHFDLNISFDVQKKAGFELAAADFEIRWRAEAQKYAAFDRSTLRLTRLTCDGCTNATQDTSNHGGFVHNSGGDGSNNSMDSDGVLLNLCILAGILMTVAALITVWCWFRRRRRSIKNVIEEISEEALTDVVVDNAVLAQVAYSFSPKDVEDDKVFQDSCLELQEGALVEVIAGGGGWFYGRMWSDGDEPRLGYFPESHVSWVGTIADDGLVTGQTQHRIVAVESEFSPEALDASAVGDDTLLQLAAGEMVQVVAGVGGWLYGHVVGEPDRCGYFPGASAKPLASEDSEEGVDKLQQGTLVKVNTAFSPGFPGDAEEEVSFADSCIALAEGDVVEVVASGGGWLYGRVVGSPDRAGFFPETRISWVGRPVSAKIRNLVISTTEDASPPTWSPSHAAMDVDHYLFSPSAPVCESPVRAVASTPCPGGQGADNVDTKPPGEDAL